MTQGAASGSGGVVGRMTDDFLPDAALFAAGLPEAAALALNLAAISYADNRTAERHLAEAARIAPDHAAVLIGQYRYHFYKGHLAAALAVACRCLVKAARDNGFCADWRQLRAYDADFGSYDAILPRFYMFTLKAYAYLQLRLGDLGEGRDAAMKLLELDPSDKINARLLLDVLERAGHDDV
jgi:hypothetical protein